MKFNVDAAFIVEEGSGAVGVVIRDFNGRFVAASMSLLPHAQQWQKRRLCGRDWP
jgi:hypothetical protein